MLLYTHFWSLWTLIYRLGIFAHPNSFCGFLVHFPSKTRFSGTLSGTMWSSLAPRLAFFGLRPGRAPNRTPPCPHCPVCCRPSHQRTCLFQSFFHIACSCPCLVSLLQGLLLRVPVKHTSGVLDIQTATHTRVSQCGVCWCSPYQGFPSTVRAHSHGMAFCGFRGAVHEHRQRTNTYSCTPTALVSFHCIARSLPDTLLWAPVVCHHFVDMHTLLQTVLLCSVPSSSWLI